MVDLTGQPIYRLENSYILLLFSVDGKRLSGFTVQNKLNNRTLTPAPGSDLFALRLKAAVGGDFIRAGSLKLRAATLEQTGEQQTLTLAFQPVRVRGCKLSLFYEAQLLQYDAFVRARLRLQIEKGKGEKAFLDWIDFAPFVLPQGAAGWALPPQKKAHIGPVPLSLGQPVFVDHCFFGCEFPAAQNTIRNGVVCAKRWYGRTLDVLCGSGGAFQSDCFVFGVAESPVFETVRTAFFQYIEKIARPSAPRVQYNTWFDRMLDIDEQTVRTDMLELDKARSKAGCDALDCFVLDDGWNNYSADFWTMNGDFPGGLQPLGALTERLGMSLGLWLGPRGGYNSRTASFAQQIEKAGNGCFNRRSHDICVASARYADRLTQFMADCQRAGNLSYWKIDGMALEPCRDKRHDHPIGGKDDLYYYSGLWETWINLFSALHAQSKQPLFLNLTSFCQPSPWLLQWVQSVWIQNSDDIGFSKPARSCSEMNAALTYRDGRYYDFYAVRQFCFPPARLYHHDPIFGNCAKLKMDAEELRTYLFAVMARGAALTEEYFSCSKLNDDTWPIVRAAELFGKQYRAVLRHTVLFGGDPGKGELYGYAAFDSAEGLLTVRNPSDRPQSCTVILDETIGVKKSVACLPMAQLLPQIKTGAFGTFSFGDAVEVSLEPFETKIFHFGALPAAAVTAVRVQNAQTLTVRTNRPLFWDSVACEENPVVSASPLPDGCSAVLTFARPFTPQNELILTGAVNPLGDAQVLPVSFLYFEDDRISGCGFQGNGGFSVKITFDPLVDKQLFRQGDDVALEIAQNHILFRVGDACLRSESDVTDMVQLCAVREDSGVLKLYLNGKLDAGMRPIGASLRITQTTPAIMDPARTKLYSRALAYDEV